MNGILGVRGVIGFCFVRRNQCHLSTTGEWRPKFLKPWPTHRRPISCFILYLETPRFLLEEQLRKFYKTWYKLKFSNPYFFETWWCKPLIIQSQAFRSNSIQSLKYPGFTTSCCTDIWIIILGLWQKLISFMRHYR